MAGLKDICQEIAKQELLDQYIREALIKHGIQPQLDKRLNKEAAAQHK